MDLGLRSPLLDFFKQGEVARDVRLLAADGGPVPREEGVRARGMNPVPGGNIGEAESLRMIAFDRNLQEPLKLAVRKRSVEGQATK